jgi:hypothetical protein
VGKAISYSCISLEGPLFQDESPDFIAIKSSQHWFSREGFSSGVLHESRVQMCYGFLIYLLSLFFVDNLAVL